VTDECTDFINGQSDRFREKFEYLLQIIEEQKQVKNSVVKKLVNTDFYELRIKVQNEYRIIIFALDNQNFDSCTKAILLNGFHKKATKDYPKAIKKAEKILYKYLNTDNE